MEKDSVTNDDLLKDLFIVVNGVPTNLNVVGTLKNDKAEYLVVTDLPIMDIGKDEYTILGLMREEEGKISVYVLEKEEHDFLCDKWEAYLKEDSNDS